MLADDLAVAVYQATRGFPKEELYGLTNQMRRAVVSVAANIVEGSAREGSKEYLHFLHIARGSLAETQYFLHLAKRLGYFKAAHFNELDQSARQTFACLHGLIVSVRKETVVP